MWCSMVWQKVPCCLHLQGRRIRCTWKTVKGIGIVSMELLTLLSPYSEFPPSPHCPYIWTNLLCAGIPPAVKGLIWFTDGSRTAEGTEAWVYGQSVGRRLSISLGKHATVFQAEVYTILACIHETETQDRPEKYVIVCSDSQVALKALQAVKSPHWWDSARRCSMISLSGTLWGYSGSLDMLGYEEMKSPTSLQETVLFKRFVGTEPFFGSLRRI